MPIDTDHVAVKPFGPQHAVANDEDVVTVHAPDGSPKKPEQEPTIIFTWSHAGEDPILPPEYQHIEVHVPASRSCGELKFTVLAGAIVNVFDV